MGKKVSAFRDPATKIDDDDRRSAAPAAWHTEEEEKNSTAAAGRYEQRLIIIRVNYANANTPCMQRSDFRFLLK